MNSKRKKNVTMKDIALKLNLSVNAISLALNDIKGVSEDTKLLVMKTAKELGYYEDNSYLHKKYVSKSLCLLIRRDFFTETAFYSRVIYGIENQSKKQGYDIIVNFINNEKLEIPSCIENRKVSGVLIVGTINDEYISQINKFSIPMVLVDHASLLISTDAILTQNMSGSYMATKYLIEKGHKKIGFFGDHNSALSFKERWLGYYECIRDYESINDLSFEKVYEFSPSANSYQGILVDHDYLKTAELIKTIKTLPTAFVCCNDITAIYLINALSILNIKVPEDISVIGFDDIDMCNITNPKLSSLHVDKELMGEKAINRLIWRMENPKEPYEKIAMDVKLIERESVIKIN